MSFKSRIRLGIPLVVMRRTVQPLQVHGRLLTIAASMFLAIGNPAGRAAPSTGLSAASDLVFAQADVMIEARSLWDGVQRQSGAVWGRLTRWYEATPPWERVTRGGQVVCVLLVVLTLLDRLPRVRRSRVVPAAFRARLQARMATGNIDVTQALDYCELNPSAASRVSLSALKRAGRPTSDQERAVALAVQAEIDHLRRGIGTLRRLAGLAPLFGLLGSLTGTAHALRQLAPGGAWDAVATAALVPVTFGVAMAIISLVAYDGLTGAVEKLANELNRIGAETVDYLSMFGGVARVEFHRGEAASIPHAHGAYPAGRRHQNAEEPVGQ